MTMLAIFAVIATFFFAFERLAPRRPQPVVRRGFWADVLYIPVNVGMRIVVNGTIAVALAHAARAVLPPGWLGVLADRPTWLQAVVLIVVVDAIFYATHRAKHAWDWWWRLHETHHSSVDMDWLASVRFHPLEKVLDRCIYLLPVLVLGPSDGALLAWAVVDALFGTFEHANVRVKLGPFIYVLNGPEMHQWHHVPGPDGMRRNFGNNLSIFDWLFGTAYLPGTFPERFGTDDPRYPHENLLAQFAYAFRREAPVAVGNVAPRDVPDVASVPS